MNYKKNASFNHLGAAQGTARPPRRLDVQLRPVQPGREDAGEGHAETQNRLSQGHPAGVVRQEENTQTQKNQPQERCEPKRRRRLIQVLKSQGEFRSKARARKHSAEADGVAHSGPRRTSSFEAALAAAAAFHRVEPRQGGRLRGQSHRPPPSQRSR